MARKVYFLGVAASQLEKLQIEEKIPADAEIWVVNEGHRALGDRKPSRVFQLHVRNWRELERRYLNNGPLPDNCDPDCFGRNNEHVDYLRTCGVPVYGQQVWDDIPTSVCYPFERVREAVGISLPPDGRKRLWATSSFGYMAALLLMEHYSGVPTTDYRRPWDPTKEVAELILIGIELPLGTNRERLWEWPNFAYYLGLATGLGITITLPSYGTALLSAPHYALGGHPFPGEPDHWHWPGYPGVVWDDEDGVYRLGEFGQERVPPERRAVGAM